MEHIFEVNTFSKIGNTHSVCQDYAIGTQSSNGPILIVSDGCSSVDNAELGSLLLSHVAKNLLFKADKEVILDPKILGKNIIDKAREIAHSLSIHEDTLAATLLLCFQYEDDIYVYVYGDGAVAIEDLNGKVTVDVIDYECNMPFYLCYDHISDDIAYRDSLRYHGKDYNSKNITRFILEEDKVLESKAHEHYSHISSYKFNVKDFKHITLFSDGIASFVDKQKNYKTIDAIKQCIEYKNFKGLFVKRKAVKVLKTLAENGFDHYDDFTFGAIFNTSEASKLTNQETNSKDNNVQSTS